MDKKKMILGALIVIFLGIIFFRPDSKLTEVNLEEVNTQDVQAAIKEGYTPRKKIRPPIKSIIIDPATDPLQPRVVKKKTPKPVKPESSGKEYDTIPKSKILIH